MTSETEPGFVQWHSSEEDGGPDVGLLIGLGNNKALWIGERSNREGGGTGIVVYENQVAIENAALTDFDAVRDVFEFYVAAALRARSLEGTPS